LEPQTASRLSSLWPGTELVLDYLTPEDERWLEELLRACARGQGRKLVELRERLSEPLPVRAPKHKLRAAAQVLLRLLPEPPAREPTPRAVRARLFRAAAASGEPRSRLVSRVAEELAVDASTVEQTLFSDLAGERRLASVPADLTPSRLALLVNRALVHGHLKRAHVVHVTTSEPGVALARQARRLGLICVARAPVAGERFVLEVSGPFALFRRTERYGRALSSLLAEAARAPGFELSATCEPRGRGRCTLRITGASPIFGENAPAAFDSRARTRLSRDLARLGPELRLTAEPAPLSLGGELLFPDLELLPPGDSRPYRFELVGFWTPAHLRKRLAQLRDAGEERYVLCVDEARGGGREEAKPVDARVLYYRSRLHATALLAHLKP
jgi:uncharacterized protein